jgi:hypothetical protein
MRVLQLNQQQVALGGYSLSHSQLLELEQVLL